MSGILELMKLCRFCLVKDKVDVPIFGEANDVKQIFMKISACLPVKVSRDDNLPKNICDNCVYKVESLYHFWNTTVSSEKQLIQWLGELGVNVQKPSLHSIQPETVILKQEKEDSNENESLDIFGYNQQYQSNQNPPAETSTSTTTTSNKKTPAKAKTKAGPKRRGRPPGKKTEPPAKRRTRQKEPETSEDDDDSIGADDVPTQDDSDEDFGNRVAKEEQESEDDFDNTDALEPTTYIDVPSENADNDQPGPSGINKPAPITATDVGYLDVQRQNNKNLRKVKLKNKTSKSTTSIKIPLIWQKGSVDEMTIKVEPMDALEWENQLSLIDDLKEKMGLIKKKIKKSSAKLLRKQKRKCVICRVIIKGRSQLIEHYLVHKEDRIKINTETIQKDGENEFFQCCICMKEFVDKIELDSHASFHVERPYFCELCTKSFKLTQNFLAHMNTHDESKELHKCDFCDFESTFKLAFDKHIRSHSREEYRCEICNKTFPARTWFLEHKNFHTGERPFSCEECGKCFPYSRYLTAHKKSMHPHCYFKEPELNECKICKKRYSHKNSLRLHMKSHTGENIYLCDICGKSLSSTDKLQLHKRIHTGYKPYACNICEKAFTKKDILTDHLRVHSGEKPFACETCGKCFSQRSPLTIHRRYHTGERPYVCHLCNKGFVSKGILGIHLKQGKH